jgi:signal peptidase I
VTDVVPSQPPGGPFDPKEQTLKFSVPWGTKGAWPPDGGGPSADGDRKPEKKRSFWKELPILVVTALLLTFLIQTFLARVYVIPSESMERTLHGCAGCTNDRVLVDKLTYDFTKPSPGDVAVFRAPDNWNRSEFQPVRSDNPVLHWLQDAASVVGLAQPNEYDLIKRVIAVGGQTVQCCDNNRVVVDGKPLNEGAYITWRPDEAPQQMAFGPVKVPDGKLWMMGDNRNNSNDSRLQVPGDLQAGAVPVANVIGKARFIVLPPTRWRGVTTVDPQAQAAALGAPEWQTGLPAGLGAAMALPTLWIGRRLRKGLRSLLVYRSKP